MFRKIFFVALLIFFSTTSTAFAEDNNIDWDKRIIRMNGLALGPKNFDAHDDYWLYWSQARRAARLDALRGIFEALYGMAIDESGSDENFDPEKIITSLNYKTFWTGVRTTDVKYYSDGVCEVFLEMDLPADLKRPEKK